MRKASRCVVYSWFDIQEQTAHTSSIRHWEEKPPVGATESLSGMLFLCPAPSLLSLFQMYFLLPADRSLLLTRPSSRCVSGITSMQNEPFFFVLFHFSASLFHVFIEISIRFGVSMICRSFRLCLRFTSEACWERCCITFPFVSFLRHPFLTEL